MKSAFLTLSIAVLMNAGLLMAQETKLVDPEGGVSDRFGRGVAISGNTAIVGSPSATVDGKRQGAAFIYVKSGNGWTLQQKIFASDGTTGMGFGWAVDLQGDTAVVGAHAEDFNHGSVYVFTRTGNLWTRQQKLLASDRSELSYFGVAVAVDGDTLAVGSSGAGTSGATYMFTRSGTVWTERQILLPSDVNDTGRFGSSVAISGTNVLVGETGNLVGINGTRKGAAYFFTKNGVNWTEKNRVTASDGRIGDGFSWSVALQNDTALIGALPANNSGHAYVFRHDGTNWLERQKLIPSDGATNKGFGSAISMEGDFAIIGALGDDLGKGSAYVFNGSGTNWTELLKLTPLDRGANGRPSDQFGSAVGITANAAIIGTHASDISTNLDQGAAYVYFQQQPTLDLRFNGTTSLVMSWPTNFVGFVPETSTNLSFWSTVSPAPMVNGSSYVVTNSPNGPARFYRLRQ